MASSAAHLRLRCAARSRRSRLIESSKRLSRRTAEMEPPKHTSRPHRAPNCHCKPRPKQSAIGRSEQMRRLTWPRKPSPHLNSEAKGLSGAEPSADNNNNNNNNDDDDLTIIIYFIIIPFPLCPGLSGLRSAAFAIKRAPIDGRPLG